MKYLIIFIASIFFIAKTTKAQTYPPKLLSVKSIASREPNPDNVIDGVYNGTDKDGNYYSVTLCQAGDVIGNQIAPYEAIAVAKWPCGSDTAQWVKWWYNSSIGTNTYILNTIIDDYGNTYINGNCTFGSTTGINVFDTILPFTAFSDSMPSSIYIKLDKNGNREWMKFPTNFFITNISHSQPSILYSEFDDDGNIDYLMFNKYYYDSLGDYNGLKNYDGQNLAPLGYYVVKINPLNGSVIKHVRLQIDQTDNDFDGGFGVQGSMNQVYETFVSKNNNYYLSGTANDTLKFGNFIVNDDGLEVDKILTLSFDSSGQALWVLLSQAGLDSATQAKPVLNGNFDVTDKYVFESIFGKNYTTAVAQSLNNIPFPTTNNNTYPRAGIAVIDANTGVILKTIQLQSEFNVIDAVHCHNNNLYVSGTACGTATFSSALNATTDTIVQSGDCNQGMKSLFVAKLDADSLATFRWGVGARSYAINAITQQISEDIYGNVYAAGYQDGALQDSAGNYINISSNQFVLKIGDPANQCICVVPKSLPSLLSATGTTVQVSATSTASVDSMVWLWGDGTQTLYSTAGAAIGHSYASGGNKTICLRSYIACGYKDSCISIKALAVGNEQLGNIQVYPNPTSGFITIDNPYTQAIAYSLQNQQGQLVMQGNLQHGKQQLNLAILPSGMYYMIMLQSNGVKVVQKVLISK